MKNAEYVVKPVFLLSSNFGEKKKCHPSAGWHFFLDELSV